MPGDYGFDPLGLAKGKSTNDLKGIRMKELNNGRMAMIAIAAMVGQELNTGINVLAGDAALNQGELSNLEAKCAGAVDEAACSRAFEAAIATL